MKNASGKRKKVFSMGSTRGIRLTKEQDTWLNSVAEREGLSFSSILRRLVIEAMRKGR